MAKEYDNTNRGALFKNTEKETDDHPDYRGSINFGGVDCWLSAWIKRSKEGKPYMSLSVKPKERQTAVTTSKQPAPDPGDDIPF